MANPLWKLEKAARDFALAKGEEIARLIGFSKAPVDPFKVILSESGQILAEGDDFRDSFDGRLSYHDGRFLLLYNTRYNRWSRNGEHHPKVRFTVGHELGHYFLDDHREFLVRRRQAIESFTEFESNKEVERQADAFAVGLLMPQYLVAPHVNCEPDATMASIKEAAAEFDVSLTGMMVRWTQLSHFPCAAICVRQNRIEWGFVSESLREARIWSVRRGRNPMGEDFSKFAAQDPSLGFYREGQGAGFARQWLDGDTGQLDVREYYAAIPYSQATMVFLVADEADLASSDLDDAY
ncbi:MAG: ImmA/IrrE family metallo-endopeptidase [Phycisphaerales bacterium]|nr:ImmA/IrrE family metallo-endopeptidase [Phycisphaerales bacterium]